MEKKKRRKKNLFGRKVAGDIEALANSDTVQRDDPELHLELNKAVALANKAKGKTH